MAHITKEELFKLAKMSQLAVADNEVDGLISSLQDVLGYAERVKQLAHIQLNAQEHKNVNVWREDVERPTDAQQVLSRSNHVEEHFFVVPSIVQQPKGE